MTADRYPSVPERITWTTGFRCATDKHVLGILSTFANFRTGVHADMWLETLVDRAKLPRRTVIRSLRRLEDDGWLTAKRRHRHRTVYDINVDRLATHWMEAKLVEPLSATGGTQPTDLSATGGTQTDRSLSATDDHLSAMGGTQAPDLSATGGTPRSPVRTDPLFDHKEPALRAVCLESSVPTTTPAVVDDEAKVDRQPKSPQQLTLGPQDVRPPPTPDLNWRQRYVETLRNALRKHG